MRDQKKMSAIITYMFHLYNLLGKVLAKIQKLLISNQINNIFKVLLNIIGLLLIILPPFIINVWLFPLKGIEINNSLLYPPHEFSVQDIIIKEKSNDSILRRTLAGIIQTTLNLEYYDIVFRNNSIIPTSSDFIIHDNPMEMELRFNVGDPNKYGVNTLNTTTDPNFYTVNLNETKKFRYNYNDKMYIRLSFSPNFDSRDSFKIEDKINPFKLFKFMATIQPSGAAWWSKLLVVCIFWIIFLPSFIAFTRTIIKMSIRIYQIYRKTR